ncbi:MAG: hypothetical protein J6R42_01715 [Clostridia bacterium]|nr:hypothetical protein [Clostridia bacterium]
MKLKNLFVPDLYRKKETWKASTKLIFWFLGIHLALGLLHFPVYLASDYGLVLPPILFFVQRLIYPLADIICYAGVVICFTYRAYKQDTNPLSFWLLLFAGEAISTLIVMFIERLDTEYATYILIVIILNALLDTLKNLLAMAVICAVLHFVLLYISNHADPQELVPKMAKAVGYALFFDFFCAEIIYSIQMLSEMGWRPRLDEVLLMLLFYVIYAVAAYVCTYLIYSAVRHVIQTYQGDIPTTKLPKKSGK